MKNTIQTIFDNIILSECSFRNDFITIYSNYKEHTLEVCFNRSDYFLENITLWYKETQIKLSEKQEQQIVKRIEELQEEYMQNENDLEQLRKDFYYDIGSKPYLKN